MPEPTLSILAEPPASTGTVVLLSVTGEQQQALAECVAIVAAHPELSKSDTGFLLELWAAVALDETLEG